MSDSQLLSLCSEGDADAVRELIASNANVNIDIDGNSPLKAAVANRHYSVALVLVEAGANVNATDDDLMTPIFFSETAKMANLLLDHGADIEHRNASDRTPLLALCDHYASAITTNGIGVAKTLINRNADVTARNSRGETALMIAAKDDHARIADLLLERGLAINDRDDHGHTALYLAVCYKRREVIQRLLAAGADVNIADSHGRTPLIACDDPEIGALLLDSGADVSLTDLDGRTAVMNACMDDFPDMLSLFINRGVDVFSASDMGYTTLMHACLVGHVDIVKLLLQTEGVTKGWVDHADEDGNTALSLALEIRDTDCIAALISAGANVNTGTVDSTGMTILQMAGEIDILKMLLEAGAVDKPSVDGMRTLLLHACGSGDEQRARLLLEYKSDINALDEGCDSALSLAIWRGESSLPLVRILLEADPPADVNLRLDMGRTALFDAASVSNPDMVKMLLEAGADPRVVDEDSCGMALMLASDGETAAALIDAAPDTMNHRDRWGRSVLHYYSACRFKFGALEKLFVKSGDHQIDINDRDANGDTALHMAMMDFNVIAVKLLLDIGADVLSSGYEGSTVLMKPFFGDDVISCVYFGMDVRYNDSERENDSKSDDGLICMCLHTIIHAILRGEGGVAAAVGGDGQPAAKRMRR